MNEDVEAEVAALRSLLDENNVCVLNNDEQTEGQPASVTVWVGHLKILFV